MTDKELQNIKLKVKSAEEQGATNTLLLDRVFREYVKIVPTLVSEIEQLQAENTRLKAERDKAVGDLERIEYFRPCEICYKGGANCIFGVGDNKWCINFKWRGLEDTN